MTYSVILVKLLREEYVESFLDGNLYLNTATYFSQLDQSDTVRADPNDSISEARKVREVAIQDDKGNWVPIGDVQNPIIFRSDELRNLNILCLYTLTDRQHDSFDERNLEFGSVAIFISNLPEFVRRVREAAATSKWSIQHGPIDYVNRIEIDGSMGPFRKFQDFSYQREFRFAFITNKREACYLNVGNLRDITFVRLSADVARIWEASRPQIKAQLTVTLKDESIHGGEMLISDPSKWQELEDEHLRANLHLTKRTK